MKYKNTSLTITKAGVKLEKTYYQEDSLRQHDYITLPTIKDIPAIDSTPPIPPRIVVQPACLDLKGRELMTAWLIILGLTIIITCLVARL
jgi:hypothetical protein